MVDLTSLFNKDPEYARQITQISSEIARIVKENYGKEYGYQSKLASFQWNIVFNGDIYELTFTLPPHWKFAEYGRRPGPFPTSSNRGLGWVNSILQWIRIKQLVPRIDKNIDSDIAKKQMAWAITKKIQKYGFKGKYVLANSLQQVEPQIQALALAISKMLNKDVTNEVRTIFDGLESFEN
jgi:hypothetical protein